MKDLPQPLVGLALWAALLTPHCLQAQGLASVGQTKVNLDLPYDAAGQVTDEQEAPEIVHFYGQNYEGDGIFYVIDRSGSMQDSCELRIAKREVVRNVSEFSRRVQFAIVFFDANVEKFPPSGQPMDASPGNKQAAIGWVMGVQGGSGSCCQQGIVAALEFANKATVERVVVIYVGDGGGTCPGSGETQYHAQTLGVVKVRNYRQAQINCVGVLEIRDNRRKFMQSLARMNGGTYTEIKR